jgi:signal transduction histidine kinase
MAQAAPKSPPDAPVEAAEDAARRRERRLARHARALDDAKRAFLRMVSHELRTPLNSIIGFSEILTAELYGPLGAPQYRQYAEHVRQSGHRLLTVVNQVLEIARLQGRAVDLDLRSEPLDHVLDDVRDQLREDLAAQAATVEVDNDGALPSVLADSRGLRSLLFNVMQNAVIYGPRGGAVRVSARDRGDGCVEIDVQDQGEGVDPADIPRLMNPFEQGDNALTRQHQGAGLGLPIAWLQAEAMSGQLRMTSAPGEGVCVRVILPAA